MADNLLENTTATATSRDPRELWAIFESAEDLPTLPEVALKLQTIVDDPKSSAKDVAKLISEDPAMATKVLKIVNSAFYSPGYGSEITELQPAIARLGFLTVSNIALSTSIFQAFSKANKPVFDRRQFWKHSICVGIVASVVHEYAINNIDQHLSKDTVHLAGIVHDIGKILFERYANTEFHQAINSAKQADIPCLKEECRFIGMGHDEVGGWLAQKWKLGRTIQAAIRWHHDPLSCPDEDLRPLAKLIHIADYICHNQSLGQSGNPTPSYDHRVREELQLTPDNIAELMDVVEKEAEKSDILVSLTT